MANLNRDSKGNVKPFSYTEEEKQDISKEYCPFSSYFKLKFYCEMVEEWSIRKLLTEKISIKYEVIKHEIIKEE